MTTVLAVSRTAPRAFITVAALLTLAGSTGSAIGAALIEVSARLSGAEAPAGVPVVAESFFTGMVSVLVVLAIVIIISVRRRPEFVRTAALTGVAVRDRAHWVLGAIAVVTLAVVVATLDRLDGGEDVSGFAVVSGWLVGLALVGVGVAALRMGAMKAGSILAMAGVLVPFWWDRIPFTGTAITVTLVLPLALVVTRIWGAWGDRERRRALAVPWDVGSFFGRRYHPFAPPSYGETVRRELAEVIDRLPPDATIVLGGHSQGSVVGAVAIDLIERDVRLLTYGSPLGSLYARYFPRAFGPDRWQGIGGRVGGRWINLWRDTDPVAGPIPAGADDRQVEDTHLHIHAAYWHGDEPAFAQAIEDLTT